MANCKLTSTPGYGPELSTKQPEDTLLNEEETQRYQAITGSVMYLAQITRYDIMYSTCQLARAMSRPSKVHMGAAKHLLRYLAGTTDSPWFTKMKASNLQPSPTPTGATTLTTGSRRRATSCFARLP